MIDYQQLVTNLVLMVFGAIGTGALWGIQKVLKLRRDIDWAFVKIRELQKEVFEDERDVGKGCDKLTGKVDY